MPLNDVRILVDVGWIGNFNVSLIIAKIIRT